MPLSDSLREQTGSAERTPILAHDPDDAESEEIETPIESGAQAQAEHEFETQRKIPDTCHRAIVSVNGKDVDEVPLPAHERAA